MDKTQAQGNNDGQYVDNTPGQPESGTALIATDRNAIQGEILNAITSSGITPSANDNSQLAKAMIASGVNFKTAYKITESGNYTQDVINQFWTYSVSGAPTIPADVRYVLCYMKGGGGSGSAVGNSYTGTIKGAGGGSDGIDKYVILDLKNAAGGSVSISIGAGGTASTTSNLVGSSLAVHGQNGNDTTITTVNDTMDAVGGYRGVAVISSNFIIIPPGKGARNGSNIQSYNDDGSVVNFFTIKRGEGSRGSLGTERSSTVYASAGQQGFVWIYF